ncbi:hypothetical protein GUI51_09445 [Enterococcus mundtii]|uniref:Uncharacterized protein n=1 Tax=Enterococcus mundtii TaxID=53346 RepID=A0ABQ0VHM8_ENTMU|nr:hypothetical protein [Enterococcus mundtii]GEN18807.1 hypothetical protein LAC02_20880 [Ligilactobacillus acidipiscis]AUB52013.1 hypothetical protein EM4838_03035 [Enterococcus mundtii]MZZ58356.1 hypothetical protein [Enterococcus mundtii]MZZ61332.1 hypothetical protein [Enterococcus mundtii]MZZ68316.1 hypothetical protein [Enterococcus mundtii]
MKVKDRFKLASKTDDVFIAEIVTVNFREPRHKYLLYIYENGEYLTKVFCSEEFFAQDGVDKVEAE